MSAPDRNDKVWICSGCAHGFMFTLRQGQRVYSLFGPSTSDDPDKTEDSAYCLCSHPTMIAGLNTDENQKTPLRTKIGVQVLACDGFVLKDQKP